MKKILLTLCFWLFLVKPVFGVEKSLEVKVTDVINEEIVEINGIKQDYQLLEGIVIKGNELVGETVYLENGQYLSTSSKKYNINDVVYVSYTKDTNGMDIFLIIDYKRTDALIKLLGLFLTVIVIVAGFKGFMSVLSMGLSFLVVFKYILPGILAGDNPIFLVAMSSLVMVPLIFYLSHGVNRKTSIAIVGTIISLVFTALLAIIFIDLAKLSGLVSDEANFVVAEIDTIINLRNLLLAGVIIGALGVLDDVTVSQASIVAELKQANNNLDKKELFEKAMKVGRDHIASMVNTLILVYAGASLPLLLLFVNNPHPPGEVINLEIVAEEVVKTLVGSIGLVMAVPITTYLAVLFFDKTTNSKPKKNTKATD